MIRDHYSLIHAKKVLTLVRKKMKGTKLDITVESWSNGREQGFYMERYDSQDFESTGCALVFAQTRSGESIVIIYGNNRDFDITTHAPSDKLWDHSREHFDEDAAAADFIADKLAFYPLRELAKK